MPNYDEYLIAYKDRWTVRDQSAASLPAREEFANLLIVDGRLRGTWRRRLGSRATGIEVRLLRPLNRNEARATAAEAERLGAFVGAPVTMTFA